MSGLTLLSVGLVYDYPLLGGEKLYDLIPTFNDKFKLNLTEENFDNVIASRLDDGLIGIVVFNNETGELLQFINQANEGVITPEPISFIPQTANVIKIKPVKFKEEIEFLSTLPLDTAIAYNIFTASKLHALAQLLLRYGNKGLSSIGEKSVEGAIIRYYGVGENAPIEYGNYPNSEIVCIVDINTTSSYQSYAIRTEKDYVANNGD